MKDTQALRIHEKNKRTQIRLQSSEYFGFTVDRTAGQALHKCYSRSDTVGPVLVRCLAGVVLRIYTTNSHAIVVDTRSLEVLLLLLEGRKEAPKKVCSARDVDFESISCTQGKAGQRDFSSGSFASVRGETVTRLI